MRFSFLFLALVALFAFSAASLAPRAVHAAGDADTIGLVMVEQPGCHWCEMWDREISAIYPKTPEGAFAPLRRVQLAAVRRGGGEVTPLRAVTYTPTFLLVQNGMEIARIEGYPGEDMFWWMLDKLLDDKTAFRMPGS